MTEMNIPLNSEDMVGMKIHHPTPKEAEEAKRVFDLDPRVWKGSQPSVEHDLHDEVNPKCDICQNLACGHGTLYSLTCDLCKDDEDSEGYDRSRDNELTFGK